LVLSISPKLLGLEGPWVIREIKFDHKGKRVDIFMDFPRGSKFPCPVCGIPYGVWDTEERTWRHFTQNVKEMHLFYS